MVNETLSIAERRLALTYVPRGRRALVQALFALDDQFAAILRSTSDPMVGQMRLTWWHGALTALDETFAPAQPVLQALAREVLPHGVSGAQLAQQVEGWEALLAPDPLPDAALMGFAQHRGGGLFVAAGESGNDPLSAAGAGWALVDLTRHSRNAALTARASALAAPLLAEATARRWSRPNRALGALAHLARREGAVARALWHRLTGL